MITASTLWFAVAAGAFALVLVTMAAVGAGPLAPAGQTISQADAARMLAALSASGTPGTVAASPDPADPAPGTAAVYTSAGSARFGCADGAPVLDYVSPISGFSYSSKSARIGTLTELFILLGDGQSSTQIEAHCVAGRVQTSVS